MESVTAWKKRTRAAFEGVRFVTTDSETLAVVTVDGVDQCVASSANNKAAMVNRIMGMLGSGSAPGRTRDHLIASLTGKLSAADLDALAGFVEYAVRPAPPADTATRRCDHCNADISDYQLVSDTTCITCAQ